MMNYRTKKGRAVLELKIKDYFAMCDEANEASGKEQIKPYTVSGLLCHLDMSKKELESLCDNRALSKVIGGAKRKIEAYTEENALNGRLSSSASINSLKEHFGWSEKKDAEESGKLFIELCDEAKQLGA